ncbi:MAG: hypothetical protein ACLU8W_13430 [Clostridia bacterium]
MIKDVRRDLGIISYAAKSIKWMYILRKALTFGVIVFTGVELLRLFLKNKEELSEKVGMFF